ncbi:hypothetical protein [Bacillus sp. Cr_A10]|uniref:hypothetical protein n=1 Tax=Bacillus sp. Cr_A10 TaxID=3033993 RepID=UPI0023DC82DE|nr:hypothetical protein [Bacillus sp. Cr_A10]MDF2067308.1 hypothetical protein [Bacillus sp. Cr_A10]
MLSRLEKYKRKPIKKATIIAGALCLSIGLGGGVKTALADQDVQLLMANWFSKKQDESLKEIDAAINTERDLLMGQLKGQLQEEMKIAEEQLAAFTASEKQSRIAALQTHAEKIRASMKVDNSPQKAAILANLDAILNQAKAQMDGQAVELKLIPVPTPVTPTTPSPEVVLEPTPETGEKPELTPGTENDEQPQPTPTTEVSPIETVVEAKPQEPAVVDIYSVTDWFLMPNTQNVVVEELSITGDVFSINSTFSDIMMNPKAHEVMNSILRGIENHPQFHQIQYKTIEEMSRVSPSLFNEKVLFLLNKSLSTITI